DIDNPTTAARYHFSGHALQAEKHSLGVDAMDAVPVFLGELHDIGAACHTSVVHQDVDRPKSGHSLADQAGDVLYVSYGRWQRCTPPSDRRNPTAGPRRRLTIDIHHRYIGAFLSQRQRRGFADTLACTSYQGHLISQHHMKLL